MDPVLVTDLATKIYQVGGILGLLLVGMCILIYTGYKDSKKREVDLVVALEKCHGDKDTEVSQIVSRAIGVIASNNHHLSVSNQTMEKLCTIIDEEFKRRDKTPPNGLHSIRRE